LDDDSFPSTASRPAPPLKSACALGSAASITALAALPTHCSGLLLGADRARRTRDGMSNATLTARRQELEPQNLAIELGGHVAQSSHTAPLVSFVEEVRARHGRRRHQRPHRLETSMDETGEPQRPHGRR
jgi:hypothetical protein